jgi:hypothetical protein
MAHPLPRDEDWRSDVKAERVVLEWRAVPVAHEKADQAGVGIVHLLLPSREADAGGVDDGEVRGHGVVQPDEAVVEDLNTLFGDGTLDYAHRHEFNQGIGSSSRLNQTQVTARS